MALLCKFAAVVSLRDGGFLVLSLIPARWAVVVAATFPLARTIGMATLFWQGFSLWQLVIATVWAAVAAAVSGWRGFIAFVAACAVVFLCARLAHLRLGGLNGDVYGAIEGRGGRDSHGWIDRRVVKEVAEYGQTLDSDHWGGAQRQKRICF